MRLTFPLLLMLLSILLIGFLITNAERSVAVTLWHTEYPAVSLGLVTIVALTIGVVFTAVVALVEGAAIRLSNRRLRREVQRLETENRFLRSQPPPARPEPVAELLGPSPPPVRVARPEPAVPAAAPVYEPEDDEPL